MNIVDLFDICNNRRDYTTVKVTKKKFERYEVDYKFQEEGDTLYIFFEPSDGRIDWRVNFSYWRKPYKDMEINYRVHGGFLESWKLIEDIIIEKVTEKAPDGAYRWRKVVIAGYSHGGALAALCHEGVWFHREDLREKEGALVGISFDGPRMFAGLKIPKELKERWRNFYVFRNHSDIVTHLPPVIFFFRHVGDKVMIGAGDNPGLIKAHYPGCIRDSLVDFMENGEMELKEKINSMIQTVKWVAAVVEDVRNLVSDSVCNISEANSEIEEEK